jgi:long-chain acyl-CoA synthetase
MTTTADPARSTAVTTVASLISERARTTPDGVAMREKRLGIWQEITWGEYWEMVETAAHGLLALGVEVGDRVAVHSENRPEWIIADSACAATRATCMGLYPTNPAPEVEYLLSNSGTKILIAEDQEQVDKTLEVKDSLHELEKIIYIEPRGVDVYDDPMLMSWDELLRLGRSHRAANAGALAARMDSVEPDDVAYLIYTSGTTGPPKGAMLSVRNAQFAFGILKSPEGFVHPAPHPGDELVSFLPLCHVYEKAFGHWLNAAAGTVTNFGESLDTLTTDMREIQPTIFGAVPRIWEKMHAAILVRMASASRFKKLNYGIWMRNAARLGAQLVANGGSWSFGMRLRYHLGNVFLYRALKERLGLKRCRHGITAAAPIAPEVIEFFMGIGIPIFEAYGMTESAAIGTTNRAGNVILGTVGEPYPTIELRLDDETGEILMRHPAVFEGYWRNPEATAAAIDEDGWLHTGDVAEWVDGTHVKIVDRIKDIIITAGGKNISPSEIENTLKMSPFVGEAVVIGDRRKYLAALIGIDFDVVSEWAQRRRLAHTTYRDLSEKPEVYELIQKAVTEANANFASVEQIKKFVLMTKELDHEQGELTATQKVKRSVIESKFSGDIESMYG